MKMVKSLLLGSAAGLVAMSGAQAADLPVKAKPVQYVKICSLYGAGFYYIPGTDMCLKIGGWVRQRIGYGFGGSQTNGALIASAASSGTGGGGLNTRSTENFTWNTRGYITADARNQTEWGTVRSYIAIGTNTDNAGGATFSSNRAFIQLAGFTFGLSQSFYDFYSGPATAYNGGRINGSSDTGDGGQVVWGYTAQFGNGLSATVAAEAPRSTAVINANTAMTPHTAPTNSGQGYTMPDFVGNLRVDQSWGSAQIMGALHNASGTYYGATTSTGNPSDKLGFALGAGIKLLAPMIGAGDYFQAQVNYTQGAWGYVNAGASALFSSYDGGTAGTYGLGVISDSVYGGSVAAGTATDIQLTTTWGVNAAYEHYWSKKWQTSVYGSYLETSYNAVANALLCANGGLYTATVSPLCNNDFQVWNIGTRTQFNLDSQTLMGVDVVYQKLQTANAGLTTSVAGSGTQPTAVRTFSDKDAIMVRARVHRNFYP